MTLDRATDADVQRVRLLDGVEGFELRFLARIEELSVDRELVVDTRAWLDNWVADPAASVGGMPSLPAALELRLELDDLGELRSLHELPLR